MTASNSWPVLLRRLCLMFLMLAALTGCDQRQLLEKVYFTGKAQGTYYTVTYFTSDKKDYQNSIDSLLRDFDQTASLWVKTSLINRVNNNEDVLLNDHFLELFRISQEVSKATDGYFDITVGPLVRAWGFGADNKPAIGAGAVDSLLPLVGFHKVKIEGGRLIKDDARMKIDFNAVAQGYSVDLVAAFLESKGVLNYIVDIGGEVYAHGTKPDAEPWKVGIEKPSENASDERKILAELPITNQAVATSGNYRKYYEKDGKRYAHTIDPKTGYPVNHSLLSATVVAGKCGYADAYATAIMAMGTEKALKFIREKHADLEIYGIYSSGDGRLMTFMTGGLKSSLSEKN